MAGQKEPGSVMRLAGYLKAGFSGVNFIRNTLREKSKLAIADRTREATHELNERFLNTENIQEYTSYSGAINSEADFMARNNGKNSPLADQIFKNAGTPTTSGSLVNNTPKTLPASSGSTTTPLLSGPVTTTP